MSTAETLAALQWKPRDHICSCFVTIHSRYRRQTDNILWQSGTLQKKTNMPGKLLWTGCCFLPQILCIDRLLSSGKPEIKNSNKRFIARKQFVLTSLNLRSTAVSNASLLKYRMSSIHRLPKMISYVWVCDIHISPFNNANCTWFGTKLGCAVPRRFASTWQLSQSEATCVSTAT